MFFSCVLCHTFHEVILPVCNYLYDQLGKSLNDSDGYTFKVSLYYRLTVDELRLRHVWFNKKVFNQKEILLNSTSLHLCNIVQCFLLWSSSGVGTKEACQRVLRSELRCAFKEKKTNVEQKYHITLIKVIRISMVILPPPTTHPPTKVKNKNKNCLPWLATIFFPNYISSL